MVYIKGVYQTRYGVLVSELNNDYAKGQDDYPTDLATACVRVNLYETPKKDQIKPQPQQQKNHNHVNNPQYYHNFTTEAGRYTFAQNASNKLPVAVNDGNLSDRTLCYNCQTYGPYAGNSEPNIRGTTLVYKGYVMTQTVCEKYSYISKEWIFLYTQSTVSFFNNKQILTNI